MDGGDEVEGYALGCAAAKVRAVPLECAAVRVRIRLWNAL